MNTSALSDGDLVGFEDIFLHTNSIRLHAIQAGPDDGPLVIRIRKQ